MFIDYILKSVEHYVQRNDQLSSVSCRFMFSLEGFSQVLMNKSMGGNILGPATGVFYVYRYHTDTNEMPPQPTSHKGQHADFVVFLL